MTKSKTIYILAIVLITSAQWAIGQNKIDSLKALLKTDILTFTLGAQTGPAVIDATAHTVAIEVAFGTDVTALEPVITVSEGATINPASGAVQDFTNAVTYTVTAEDGVTTENWEVTVTVAEGALGLEESLALEVYPNPASEQLHVRSRETVRLRVIDLNGVAQLTTEPGLEFELEIQDLSSGTYVLIIESAEGATSRKFIKE